MIRPALLAAALVLFAGAARAADPAAGPTIVDGAGKEIVLQKWKIAAGLRPLAWLDKAPDALAFRETNSTLFKDGVLTLVPLERIQELAYDAEKQVVRARVAGVETPLEGWTRYQGINQIVVEAEIDKGAAGTVELKYRGGPKSGIKAIRFAAARPGEAPKGDKLYVTVADGKKIEPPQAVHGLQALYRTDKAGEKLLSTLMFKKTYKVDLGHIEKMTVREDAEQKALECDVTLKDGTTQSLTLLTTIPLDGKSATLEGLLGAVPAGYKLFPLHTIAEINRNEPAKSEKKDK